jgi:Protein of unknown function (DUF2797)
MQGTLAKMNTQLDTIVQYELPVGNERIPLNALLGKPIKLRFTGQILCVHCNRAIKKSFNQGYCYPCFTALAQCDMCIMKPETCHYDAGTCREPEWGESFCFQPHVVYLANSSGIKIGITRQTQTPTRWIDQGAVQALPIFKVQSRLQSGLIEVAFAKHVSDKTSWQQMLKNHVQPIDLFAKRDSLIKLCQADLSEISQGFAENDIKPILNAPIVDIHYPIDIYPKKITSFNFDKNSLVSGVLQGIKGQYLLLDTGVINIRKYTGYEVEFSV